EQALVAHIFVEQLAGDARLNDAVEILGMHGKNSVHVPEIDRDPAERRVDLPLQRRAGPEWDHRHALARADADDLLHVGHGLRKYHRVRRLAGVPGGGVGVLLAHDLRGDDPVAEPGEQRRDGALDSTRIGPRRRIGGAIAQSHDNGRYSRLPANPSTAGQPYMPSKGSTSGPRAPPLPRRERSPSEARRGMGP